MLKHEMSRELQQKVKVSINIKPIGVPKSERATHNFEFCRVKTIQTNGPPCTVVKYLNASGILRSVLSTKSN